jgi:hypothetical protein
MVETPIHGNSSILLSPWRTPDVQNMDNIDDITCPFNSTFKSLASESLLLGANSHRNELFQKIASEPHLNV